MATSKALQLIAVLLALLVCLPTALAGVTTTPSGAQIISYQDNQGNTIYLADDRKPSLYTGDFGDCLGESWIKVTRFDASYYHDNMTVIFDIQGYWDPPATAPNLTSQAVMLYIGVFAYGESRFELPFDPCKANIYSMCPVKNGTNITANGQIPLAQSDVANIPSIAYSIPDFEGQAILRIFSNTSESEIACYSAVVTNGSSFRQVASVGTILGIFAAIAVLASFATAIYGSDIPTMRTHYAHSLSVLVVFAVFQHIFFTGALSMNWPSVLVAFWANYAWSAGMISSTTIQDSFDKLTHNHRGNTSTLGAAGSGTWASNVGGGFDIHQIYKRSRIFNSPELTSTVENMLLKRATTGNDNVTGTKYYGHPVRDGLPLPGNYSGFPGTLYEEGIPASNAFLTGFVWFLILLGIVAVAVPLFKIVLDCLYKMKMMKTRRLDFFRANWMGYTAAAVLRTCYIGFFAMMFLTIFQFSYGGATSVIAIAAVVFVIFFVGMLGIVGYACYYRLRIGNMELTPNRINLESRKVLGIIPWFRFHHAKSEEGEASTEKVYAGSIPGWTIKHLAESQKSVHEDDQYIKKFGWLASRYRRTKWWFFVVWLVYEFIRACFFAGASGHAMVQVFGLLVVEFIAFLAIIKLKPFEGQRLNIIVVYLLGLSKVATVALSAAFDVSFNLARITCTAIGIIIIVIQGLLTIVLMVCIILSAVTSYFSVMRYREEIRPHGWNPRRERYFRHLDQAVRDRPVTPPPPVPKSVEPEIPKDPYFSVNSVRRAPKIEDEDEEFIAEIAYNPRASVADVDAMGNEQEDARARHSRTFSNLSHMSSASLPYGARAHRGSWSTKDFLEYNQEIDEPEGRSANPRGLLDGTRPASRQFAIKSYGSLDKIDRSGTPGHSRHASMVLNAQNEIGRSDTVSPLYHTAPPSPTPDHGEARPASPVEDERLFPPLLNTALARPTSISSISPPASPGPRGARTPRRSSSRLQKHRPRDSIDEMNETG